MASNDETKDAGKPDEKNELVEAPTPETPETPAETVELIKPVSAAPDAAAAETTEPPAADPTPAKAATPVGLLAAVGVLAALLVGLFVAWNPWFGPFNGNGELSDIDAREESAEAAACDIATKLFTYDYTKIDEFFDAVQDSSTGRFGDGFLADKEQLRGLFTESQVVSRSEETSCKVTMIGDDTARIRMQGTQIVASSVAAQGQEQSEHIDIYIDLEDTDDGWKVYDLSPVTQGTSTLPGTQTAPGTQTVPGTDGQPVPEQTPAPEVPNP